MLCVRCYKLPPGTYVFTLWLSALCMRSKAWQPRQAFSRTLMSQKHNMFSMGPERRYPTVQSVCAKKTGAAARESLRRDRPAELTSPASRAHGNASLFASCDSFDSHSFSGFSTYGRNVSISLLGPSTAGLGQREPIDVSRTRLRTSTSVRRLMCPCLRLSVFNALTCERAYTRMFPVCACACSAWHWSRSPVIH